MPRGVRKAAVIEPQVEGEGEPEVIETDVVTEEEVGDLEVATIQQVEGTVVIDTPTIIPLAQGESTAQDTKPFRSGPPPLGL